MGQPQRRPGDGRRRRCAGVSLGGAAIYHGELHQRPLRQRPAAAGPRSIGPWRWCARACCSGCWCWPDSGPWGGCMLEHGGRLREAARRYDIPLADWLDLSTGIAPWPLPAAGDPRAGLTRLPESDDGSLPPPASTTAPNGYCRWPAARRRSRPCQGCGGAGGSASCRRATPSTPTPGARPGTWCGRSARPRSSPISTASTCCWWSTEQPHRAGLRARRAAGLACPPATSRRLAAGRRGVHGLHPQSSLAACSNRPGLIVLRSFASSSAWPARGSASPSANGRCCRRWPSSSARGRSWPGAPCGPECLARPPATAPAARAPAGRQPAPGGTAAPPRLAAGGRQRALFQRLVDPALRGVARLPGAARHPHPQFEQPASLRLGLPADEAAWARPRCRAARLREPAHE